MGNLPRDVERKRKRERMTCMWLDTKTKTRKERSHKEWSIRTSHHPQGWQGEGIVGQPEQDLPWPPDVPDC